MNEQDYVNEISKIMPSSACEIGYVDTFAEDLTHLLLSKNKFYDLNKLKLAVELLSHGRGLPRRYNKHQLNHYRPSILKNVPPNIKPKNIIDIHIESDWILLYRIVTDSPGRDVLMLYRTGTHKHLYYDTKQSNVKKY